jgi:hypothetical protein
VWFLRVASALARTHRRGAIIGGLLGISGALIVAREVTSREWRSASRMLQRDLFSVKAMVDTLTHERQADHVPV